MRVLWGSSLDKRFKGVIQGFGIFVLPEELVVSQLYAIVSLVDNNIPGGGSEVCVLKVPVALFVFSLLGGVDGHSVDVLLSLLEYLDEAVRHSANQELAVRVDGHAQQTAGEAHTAANLHEKLLR